MRPTNEALPWCSAACATSGIEHLAEEEGFEPSVDLHLRLISSPLIRTSLRFIYGHINSSHRSYSFFG
jgi:hypothetical protein